MKSEGNLNDFSVKSRTYMSLVEEPVEMLKVSECFLENFCQSETVSRNSDAYKKFPYVS